MDGLKKQQILPGSYIVVYTEVKETERRRQTVNVK
jgi:hypothetical protein